MLLSEPLKFSIWYAAWRHWEFFNKIYLKQTFDAAHFQFFQT